MGVREGEARRLGEGAGCGTTVPLRSHEWVGPARWVPPGGSRPAEQQLRLPVPMTAAPEARAGAAGTGGSCGLPGQEEWWGRRGAPGKQRWARPGSQAPSFPQAPGTSLLVDWFSAQSSAAGQELESHKLKGASKSHLCQTDSRRNSRLRIIVRPGRVRGSSVRTRGQAGHSSRIF